MTAPVLFLIDSLTIGGSEKKTVAVTRELARRGHPVHIAYLNLPATLAERVDSRVPLVYLGRRGRGLSLTAVKRLGEHIRLHDIRQVLCVNLHPMVYAAAVQRMRSRDALAFDVLINVSEFVSLKQRMEMLVYRRLLPRVRRIVFGCQAQRVTWRQVHRLDETSSTCIYNGVDLETYTNGAVPGQRDELLLGWGLDPKAFIVGSVGRFRKEKNYEDLIRVVSRLVALGVHAQALIVGDGVERDRLQRTAASLGLRERVAFAGELADVRPALRAIDVFVLTSKAVETFSNAALEAMAMRCPVVLSDVGGALEMVVEGENGYVYPRGDLDRLEGILKLLHDRPALREELGNGGRAMVEERFSFSRMVDEYERLAFPT